MIHPYFNRRDSDINREFDDFMAQMTPDQSVHEDQGVAPQPRREVELPPKTNPLAQAAIDNNQLEQKLDNKIEARPRELNNAGFNDIIPGQVWKGVEKYGHTGIVGTTGSGKSHFLYRLFCDQKIISFDTYIIVSDSHMFEPLTTAIAANKYLDTNQWASLENNVFYFKIEELQKAMAKTMDTDIKDKEKLIIFCDCQISGEQNYRTMAMYINKAKNFKTTVLVEIHILTGQKESTMMKSALTNIIFLKLDAQQLKTALGLSKTDLLIEKYKSKQGHDKVVIYNREMVFGNNYLPL